MDLKLDIFTMCQIYDKQAFYVSFLSEYNYLK